MGSRPRRFTTTRTYGGITLLLERCCFHHFGTEGVSDSAYIHNSLLKNPLRLSRSPLQGRADQVCNNLVGDSLRSLVISPLVLLKTTDNDDAIALQD